jgi:Na+/H+ antiporter NhaD/arsenite permease-like protein
LPYLKYAHARNEFSTELLVGMYRCFLSLQEDTTEMEMGHIGNVKHTRIRTKEEESLRNLLLLSVAYSACIGGTGVITGNPSNLVILEVIMIL